MSFVTHTAGLAVLHMFLFPKLGALRPTVIRIWCILVFWPPGVRLSYYVPSRFFSCDFADWSFEGPWPFPASSVSPGEGNKDRDIELFQYGPAQPKV